MAAFAQPLVQVFHVFSEVKAGDADAIKPKLCRPVADTAGEDLG